MNQMLHLSATPNNSIGTTPSGNSHLKLAFMKKLFTLLFIICAFATGSFAQLKTGSTGNWNSPGTWSPSGVPANTDSVLIPSGVTITANTAAMTCGALNVLSGGNLTFQSSATRVISVTSAGGLGGTVNIAGTIVYANSTGQYIDFNGPLFTVGSGATWTLSGTSGDDGGIHYSGTTTSTLTANGKTIGPIQITGTGTLSQAGNVTLVGPKAAVVLLTVTSGNYTVNASSTLTLSATNSCIGITVASGKKITVNGTIQNSSAGTASTFTGSGALTIANGGTYINAVSTSSTLSTGGAITVQSGGTFVHNTTSGIATPISSITLSSGSNFIYRGSSSLGTTVSLAGLTFYNLAFESTSGAWNPTMSGSTATTVTGLFNIGGAGVGTVTFGNGYTGVITSGGTTIQTGSSYTPGGNIVINGIFTNNGTFTHNSKVVSFGTGGNITGTSATTFATLTIATTADADKVTQTTGATIIDGGTLNLTKGIFKLTGTTLTTVKAITINRTSPSNFANSADASGTDVDADGGTVSLGFSSGATATINSGPTFYNILCTDGNGTIVLGTTGNTRINGTLKVNGAGNSNQFKTTGNAPIWGTASTFDYNGSGQWNLASQFSSLWSASSGTVGTTAGLPNNVTLENVNTASISSSNPIAGVLSAGDGTTAGTITISGSGLTVGGIVVNTGSTFTEGSATLTVKGKFVVRTGATAFNNSSGTIAMAGSGTSGTPDSIKIATGTFYNLTLSGANAYVKLYSAVTVSNVFTLPTTTNTPTLETDATNILTITNAANTGIAGGYASSFINGPAIWQMGGSSTGSYIIPIGVGSTYYPFGFVAGSTTGTIQAQAFASAPGTADGSTLSSTSTTEYWKLITTGSFIASSFSIGRKTPAFTSENAIGKSTTNGATSYSSIGGTVSTLSGQASINTSTSGLSGASTLYLAIGTKAIVGTISAPSYTSTAPYCPGATVTGTFTYTGSLSGFTAQLSNGSGSFASPVTLTGTVSGSAGSGTFSVALPTSGVPAASGYEIEILASSPSTVTGTASTGFAISAGQNLTYTSGSTTQSVCAGTAISSIVYTIGGTATNAALSGTGSAGLTGSLVGSTYTITGTPTATGSYTVTTSGSSCTSATLSGSMTVTAASTANAGTALTGICQGGTSAALGGSVGGGATGGIWTDGGAGGTFSSATAISTTTYTPASTFIGTVTLTLTSTGGSPCTAATATKTLAVGGVSLYTPTGTPVLRYDFTAGANTNTGSTGTTNNASPQGSPSATTDRFGNATGAILLASTSSQYITQANQLTVSGFIDAGGGSSQNVVPFSSSLWFKTSSSGQMGLMEVTDNVTGNPSNYDHALFMNGGHLFYGIYDGSNTLVSTTPTYNDNKWHNVIVTMDGTNGTVLYVDGVSVVSNSAMKHTNSGSAKYCRFGYSYLGGWSPTTVNGNTYTAAGPYYFDGSIDDILLYNSTLTSGNVSTIYGTDSTTAIAACAGSGTTVTVKSNTLTTGTYTVTYNVSGTNTVGSTTASMSFNSGTGTGTFTTGTLANAGTNNNVNITAITPAGGCASATLVISTPAFSTNGISVQPATGGQAICKGSTPTALTVTAVGTATYQWFSNTSATTSGAVTAVGTGGTTASFTPSTATAGTLYYYVAVTIAGCGTVNSGFSGAIAVSATSVGGTAVATPGTLCNGNVATVTVSGNTGTIQWQQSSDNSTWSNVTGGSGATTATYTTPALSVGLYYKALSTSGSCPAASSVSDTVTVEQSNAGNGAYTGGTWNTTPNDNTTGLGPWTLNGVGGGFAGFFTGSAPNINTNSLAWGLYANNSNTAEAIRPLTGTVAVGSTASFTLQNKSIASGGVEGFSLYPATGTNPLVELYFTGGNSVYTLNDGAGTSATTIPYSSTGLNISVVYTASSGNGTYTLAVKPVGGSTTTLIPGSFKSTSGGGQVPAKLRFFNYNSAGTGSGSSFDFFVNSIALNRPVVVTQPSGAAQNACGTASSGTALTVAAYGSNLTYQWYSNSTASNRGGSLIAGATGTSYTPPATGTTVYYYAIVSGNCATDTSAASGAITVAVSSIWAGVDANWNNTSNWSCGSVPTSATSVEIPTTPTGGHYPVLTAASSVNNLILDASSTLGLAGNTLTVAGAISGAGTISGSPTSVLVLNGTTGTLHFTQIPDTLLKLTLGTNATATLSNALVIAGGANTAPGKLTIGGGATLNTNDSLTLSSDNNSAALVAAIPEDGSGAATGSISGKVTVQRYVHSNVNVPNSSENGMYNTSVNHGLRAWRMLTAPVTQSGSESIKAAWQNNGIAYNATVDSTKGRGTLVTGPVASNGIDIVSGVSMYQWNNNAFGAVSNTNVAVSNGNYGGTNGGNTGYMLFVRGDRDPKSVNNPNNGGITINNTMLNPTGSLITGRQVYAVRKSTGTIFYSLIGNPYAAPVDLAALSNSNPVARYFIWNPNLGSVGGFVSIDFIGGTTNISPVPSNPTNVVNQYVQSGQAFFVEGEVAGADGSLTIDENAKVDSNNNYVFRPAAPAATAESFVSNLYFFDGTTAILSDGNMVQYNNSFNAGVDNIDARKLTNTNENFALLRNGIKLSIERRPIIANADSLFFSLTQTTQRNYQFQFTATELNHPGLVGFLKDSYTGDSTALNLNSSTTVNFAIDTSIAASKNPTRFMVVFKAISTPLPVTFTGVKAQQNADNVAVSWDVQNEININSYVVEKSTDDKTFSSIGSVGANGQGHYSLTDVNPVSGSNYYRIRSIGSNGSVQYSTVAKVDIGAGAPAIAIYPNPVQNGTIGLQLTDMPAGKYGVRLLTVAGQVIVANTINHLGGSLTQTIRFNSGLAKGTYPLEITKPDGTKTVVNVIY